MPTLAMIIVSWNTRDLLRRCIESVHASLRGSEIDYTVVVVDNASIDGTPAMLRAEHPELLLLEPRRNLGFAGGNNLALRRVLSSVGAENPKLKTQNSKLDYVLLLNPDTEVVGDAIPRLVRYLDAHPDVAVVGPKLRYPDGSAQPSRRRFPTRMTYFWESTPLETRWPTNPWARRYCYADTPDDVEQEVDWLVGAALLVRRSVIERAGLLDASFAMYSEELEWQRRIRRLEIRDWRLSSTPQSPISNLQSTKITYLPDAVIIHHEGKSSEQSLARRYLDFQRSRLRDARMVYGERFAAALRLFLRAAYGAELAVEAAKWLLGHKRALRARRVGVYWQVMREL
ncbi:MAG TPA: glycosyltransferase family 2 protein [Roseiflexaceae bacterium]|jgi:GT2 family glycosyltransferase